MWASCAAADTSPNGSARKPTTDRATRAAPATAVVCLNVQPGERENHTAAAANTTSSTDATATPHQSVGTSWKPDAAANPATPHTAGEGTTESRTADGRRPVHHATANKTATTVDNPTVSPVEARSDSESKVAPRIKIAAPAYNTTISTNPGTPSHRPRGPIASTTAMGAAKLHTACPTTNASSGATPRPSGATYVGPTSASQYPMSRYESLNSD
ncbi:hypothetical protein LX16_2880 [Stackebrandtia albiflava]|uniref:Uncharacterized protein n=1 Tax=Stackebrandtia albiflava TaxID=406432 RepID=A0A562V2J3_9ACTN|nr:hypothetical protein [Stackebrandtia albiflava]TWJ12130.1 hypothetical protein LX16_2880 [Stackebrandtia albiflava]